MNRRTACPVCASSSTTLFLRRPRVPVHQNLLMRDQRRATQMTRGDLEMTVCRDCGFIFNAAFDLSNLSYGEKYENTQTCSPLFNEYVSDLARYLVDERGVRNCSVVEVGCGRGQFIRQLVEMHGAGNRGYGIDPSYVGPLSESDGRLQFRRSNYGPECADISADVVVCRHVIEHVPDPLAFLRLIRRALTRSPDARLFFETPCAAWILRNRVIWDLFYEHCSLFTSASLATAFESCGFTVERIRHVFGEQYLWFEAGLGAHTLPVTKDAATVPLMAEQFAAGERKLRRDWEVRLGELRAAGEVALWGAGAKGVTFANLIDPERRWIDCVVDLNPAKQGCYLPGTGHPIVSYKSLGERGVATAVLMNPNYRDENSALLRDARLQVELIG